LALPVAALIAAAGCGADEAARELPVPASAETPRAARTPLASQAVVGYVGPGGRPFEVTLRTPGEPSSVHRTIGMRTFELSLRGRPLAEYPCTSCHAGALITTDRADDAHQHVQPVHPSEFATRCGICHARDDVYQMRLQGGTLVPLDQAYRLCGQCHYAASEAWAGGAHGKRLDAWSGTRVVMGCGDCHDPHAPRVPVRIPFPGPVLPAVPVQAEPPEGSGG
jgi:hypothetical protein